MSIKVLQPFVPLQGELAAWPMELDIETKDTLDSIVSIAKTVAAEYTAIREGEHKIVNQHYSSSRIQAAYRRHRARQALHNKTLQIHAILTESFRDIQRCLNEYGEDRLSPTLEELALMPHSAQQEYFCSIKSLQQLGTSAYHTNVLKLVAPRKQRQSIKRGIQFRQEEGRVGLIICMEDDENIAAIETVLRQNLFEVMKVVSPTLAQIRDIVEAFFTVAGNDIVGMVVFSGRTFTCKGSGPDLSGERGRFFFIPSDASENLTEENVYYEAFDTSLLAENLTLSRSVLPIVLVIDEGAETPIIQVPKIQGGYVLTSNSKDVLPTVAASLSKPHSLFSDCLASIQTHNPLLHVVYPHSRPLPFFFAKDTSGKLEQKTQTTVEALLSMAVHTGRLDLITKASIKKYAV